MASFFALAVRQFPKDGSGNTSWPLRYISGLLCMSILHPFGSLLVLIDSGPVGISFGVSIPFILVAFNISWFTTPWNYMRHIWIKQALILLLKPLRKAPLRPLRMRVIRWSAQLFHSTLNYALTSEPDKSFLKEFRAVVMRIWRQNYPHIMTDSDSDSDNDEIEEEDADDDMDGDGEIDFEEFFLKRKREAKQRTLLGRFR
jgi:hypothetical protein